MEIDLTYKFMFHPALKLALEEVKKSTYRFRVAAVIFKGKRIISVAHNEVRSNSVPKWLNYYDNALHAEAAAILKSKKRDLRGYSILVIRIGKKGDLILSKPCEKCQEFIEYSGIKNIYYSNAEGKIVEEI